MKKLIQFSLLLMLMPLLAPTCRSEQFDPPSKGLTIDFDILAQSAAVNAQKTNAGEVFEKTYTVNIKNELKTRYNIDLTQLKTLNVTSVVAKFSTANCLKLDYYVLSATFPGIGTETRNTDCSVDLMTINAANNSTKFAKDVLATDFATAIKNGESITIYFKMKAKADIETGFGASVSLSTIATYQP